MRESACRTEPRANRSIAILGLVSAMLELAGCGWTPPTGSITGVVRFGGKPVGTGRITVLCEGGKKPVFFAVIANGEYSVQGAPVGAARVTVQAFAAQTPSSQAPTLPGNAPSLPIPANVPPVGRPASGFPERYLNPNTSGLRCEIKPGPQTLDFDLEP